MHTDIYWKLGSLVRGRSYAITGVIEISSFVQVSKPRCIIFWHRGVVIMLLFGSI